MDGGVRHQALDDSKAGVMLAGQRPPHVAGLLDGVHGVDHRIKAICHEPVGQRLRHEVGGEPSREALSDARAQDRRLQRID